MGILETIRDKLGTPEKAQAAANSIPGNPVPAVVKALEAPPLAPPSPQAQYEARERAANRNNPHYEDVNKPVTTEPLKVRGNP